MNLLNSTMPVSILSNIHEIKKHFEINQMLLTRGVEILDVLGQDVRNVDDFVFMELDWDHGEEFASIFAIERDNSNETEKIHEMWFKFPLVYLTMTDEEIIIEQKRRNEKRKIKNESDC